MKSNPYRFCEAARQTPRRFAAFLAICCEMRRFFLRFPQSIVKIQTDIDGVV